MNEFENGLNVFSGKDCMPCNMLKTMLKKNDIHFNEIDVCENSEFANKYGVYSIPAIFAVKDGVIVKSITGNVSISTIRQLIEMLK